MAERRSAPEGDYAALGARVILTSDCGNYGEDSLTAWKHPGGDVVIEVVDGSQGERKGTRSRWVIESADKLVVRSKSDNAGIETDLTLVGADGTTNRVTHFEATIMWATALDTDVVEMARKIAGEAGCDVEAHLRA